jgi:hypothetical protein
MRIVLIGQEIRASQPSWARDCGAAVFSRSIVAVRRCYLFAYSGKRVRDMASKARYSRSLQRRVHPLFVKLYLTDEAEEEYSDTRRSRRKVKAVRRLTRKSALRR